MGLENAIAALRDAAHAGIAAAAEVLDLADREILDVPAPLELVGGKLVAATPATPGAPPRKVTGRLQVHANRYEVAPGVWYVGVFAVPYAGWLEHETSHKYLSVVFSQQFGAMGDAAAKAARGDVA